MSKITNKIQKNNYKRRFIVTCIRVDREIVTIFKNLNKKNNLLLSNIHIYNPPNSIYHICIHVRIYEYKYNKNHTH